MSEREPLVGQLLELATLCEGIDVLLGLGAVELILGLHLGHEVILALQSGDVRLGELRPLLRDLAPQCPRCKILRRFIRGNIVQNMSNRNKI
jgi:hypothetical protein